MVEEAVIVVAEVVSLVTMIEVVESPPLSLLVGVAVPESVAESVAESLEPESPVLRDTL